MGYYTKFTLKSVTLIDGTEVPKHLLESVFSRQSYYGPEWIRSIFKSESEDVKWYDYEKEMIDLSRDFPKFIFMLTGVGEDSGDVWAKYFHMGKVQSVRAIITYEPFDLMKLK